MKEASESTHIDIKDSESLFKAITHLKKQCNLKISLITMSDQGVAVFDKKLRIHPTSALEVFDVTGAGDCFLASFVYGLTNGMKFQECLDIAVVGSTESVKRHGTYVLTPEDIRKKTVFTNGCFDILHTGHLTLLKEAKAQGDYLIVGLNSDESIQNLKGNDRPYNNFAIRRQQLELIPYVDEIIEFSEETPYNLIKDIKPNLIVKGGDYTIEEVVGHDLAPVYIVPTVKGHSTTDILKARDENTNNRS